MKRTARNILFNLIGYTWTVPLMLVVTPIIMNTLGRTGYGVWALVGNIIGYLSVFNSLQTAITKYLAEYVSLGDQENICKLLSMSFVFNLGVGTLGGGIILFLAESLVTSVFNIPIELQSQSIIAFRLAGISFCISTVGWWGWAILTGMERFDWLVVISVAATTLSALGSVLAVWLGWGMLGVVIANLIGIVLSATMYIWSACYLLPYTRWAFIFDWAIFKRIFFYGFFSTTHVIFGVITMQLDRTLLGIWIGAAAVATYSIPVSVVVRIHQLCAKAFEVVVPLSSALDAQHRSGQLKRLFLRAQNLNVVLVMMLSVPLLILAPEILRFWISSDFAVEATLVFQLLVIAYAFLALYVVMSGMMAGLGHPEVNTAFAFVLGLGNLTGYLLFIPRWGVNGAGVASVLGSAISVPLFCWYVNRRYLRVSWLEIIKEAIARPVTAGLLIGVVTFWSRSFVTSMPILSLILVITCLAYLGMTIWFGVWQVKELDLAWQTWHRIGHYLFMREVKT